VGGYGWAIGVGGKGLGLGWRFGGVRGYGVRGGGYGLAAGVRRTCSDASRGAPEMPEQRVEQATVVNRASTMRVQTQTQHQGSNLAIGCYLHR